LARSPSRKEQRSGDERPTTRPGHVRNQRFVPRPVAFEVMFEERIARARHRMEELAVDVLLLSVGADLPYFTGYTAMPLERLTMLVLPRGGGATLWCRRWRRPGSRSGRRRSRCGPGARSRTRWRSWPAWPGA